MRALALATVLVGAGSTIAMKQMANALPDHMFFAQLLATFVLTAAFFGVLLARAPTGSRLRASTLMQIAMFDTLQMALVMIGSVKTPGHLQIVLTKGVIPLTMVVRFVWMAAVPSARQVLGALIIVCGAVVSVLPRVLNGGFSDGLDGRMPWVLLFAMGSVPGAIGSVFKEKVLSGAQVDDAYLNAWVTFYQAIFTVLTLPLHSMPVLGSDAIPLHRLIPKTVDGFSCVVGRSGGEGCSDACVLVGAWIFLLFLYNILLTKLITQAGATLMFATTTLTTPVTAVLFSLPLVMGEQAEAVERSAVLGVLMICGGIALYRGLPADKKAKTT